MLALLAEDLLLLSILLLLNHYAKKGLEQIKETRS